MYFLPLTFEHGYWMLSGKDEWFTTIFEITSFSTSFHLLSLKQLTTCRFHAFGVIVGSTVTAHCREQKAGLGHRWRGLHPGSAQLPRGPGGIRMWAQLRKGIPAGKLWSNLSRFTEEDIKTQTGKVACSVLHSKL